MRRILPIFFVAVLGSSFQAAGQAALEPAKHGAKPHRTLAKDERAQFIRRAQVWAPTDIPRMDIRSGPGGAGAFQPNQLVTCDFMPSEMHGATRKFHCRLENGDVVKVRYGVTNGEVEASVVATRLLWALGFAADRVYPVRVRCRGCSSDPWKTRGSRKDVQIFDPAVIERKPHGSQMWNDKDDRKWGWDWDELNSVDPRHGGAPREQRDALKLLAVFMQHTDTKSQQQRLLCASESSGAAGQCDRPFMMLHDVGVTFGRANNLNSGHVGSVNLAEWRNQPIWKNPAACIGNLDKSRTGSLGDPAISEAGRKFLADLLVQLTDQQIYDLFDVARVERRTSSSESIVAAPAADWVAVFKAKRAEIVNHRCPR